MIRLILRLFDTMAWPIRLLGADFRQFRAILEAKLTLDTRRQTITAHAPDTGDKARNVLLATFIFNAFLGLFPAFTILSAHSLLVGMTFIHAFIMVMLGMALVTDFSSVLLDTTDNAILQPRPVGGRTIFLARTAHIVVYLSLTTLSLSLATFVLGTFQKGFAFGPVFAATLACSMCLVVFGVSAFYLVIVRLVSPERLRDLILYCHVVMSVLIVTGYQLLPRLMDVQQLHTLDIAGRGWIYLCPPCWMAGPVDLAAGDAGRPQVILTLLALIVPAISLYLAVRVLSPRFGPAIAAFGAAGEGQGTNRGPALRTPRASRLAAFCCRTPTGRAAFELVWTVCSRDRQFKLRTYPTLAFLILLPAFWLFSGYGGVSQALEELPRTRKHLFVLYMGCMMIPAALIQLRFSADWQAAWVYFAAPVRKPGEIITAAMWAIVARFVLPAYLVISVLTLAVWGPAIWADLLMAGSATLLMCILQSMLFGRRLPFAEQFGVMEGSGRMNRSLLFMLLPAALGGLHLGLTMLPMAVVAATPVLLAVALLLLRSYRRTPWSAIETQV